MLLDILFWIGVGIVWYFVGFISLLLSYKIDKMSVPEKDVQLIIHYSIFGPVMTFIVILYILYLVPKNIIANSTRLSKIFNITNIAKFFNRLINSKKD